MKRLVFVSLFLISGLTIASAQIKLSFNPEKGKKYEYLTEVIQNMKQNVMGMEIPMEMEMSFKYLMDVKDKTPQEIQTQFTYREIAYIMSSSVLKMGYDSKNPIENPSEIDNILGKMFGNMVDKSFIVNFAPDGSVKSTEGMDAIAEKMVDATSADGMIAAQVGAQMKQQFSDDAMKNMFGQSFNFYPANAVKKGDSWNVDFSTTMSNMNVSIKTKYTLKDVSKNMATIDVTGEIEMNPGAGMDGKLTGTQTGSMMIDTKTGMHVTSDISQDMKGSLKVQGMDVQMEMTTKSKTATKEVK
jgi:predicted Fe-Mo cluster-binding NifX family protein